MIRLFDTKMREKKLKKLRETKEKFAVRTEDPLAEMRSFIGSRINPLFIAGNKASSAVRQALGLAPEAIEPAEPGDIIAVRRVGFAHYGVYAGNNQVIHYDIDPSDHYKICVHQAPIEEFLNGSEAYSVCDFPKIYGHPAAEITYEEFTRKFPDIDIPRPL